MKKLFILLICLFGLIASSAFAGSKIVDLRLTSNLVDTRGNLTAGALSRVSAGTYIDRDGVLQTSWGNRAQSIPTNAQADLSQASWVASDATKDTATTLTFTAQNGYVADTIATSDNTYYNFSFYARKITGNTSLKTYHNNSETGNSTSLTVTTILTRYNVVVLGKSGGGNVDFGIQDVNASGHGQIEFTNIMLETLPSGNVIGDELIADQVDRDFSGASDWTNNDINAYDETGDLTITADGVGQYCTLAASEAVMAQNNWYIFEFDAANIVSTWTVSDFDAGFTIGTITANGTDQQIVFKYTDASTGGFRITSVANDSSMDLDNLSLKQVPDLSLLEPSDYVNATSVPAKARFETDGLLVEGEVTNLLDYSEDWSQWIGTNLKETYDTVIDPRGETNTTSGWIADATANEARTMTYVITSILTDSANYTASVFVKAGTVDWMLFRFTDKNDTDNQNYFQLSGNGTVGTGSGPDDSGIELIGNGWYRCWVMADAATGTTAPEIKIYVAEADSDITIDAAEDDVLLYVYGAQLEESPYPTSYIYTDSCPVTRTSETADGTYGYQWTMSTTLKNILSNALPGGGATPAIGTLIVEWTAGQDYDVVDTGQRGFISIRDANSSLLYFPPVEGDLRSYDSTNAQDLININWAKDDSVISVVRWDSTADSGAGYLLISSSKNGTWTLNTGNESAFDGAFALGTYLWLNYSNELPIHIQNIKIYDGYMTDAAVEDEVWDKTQTGFPLFPIWDRKPKAIEYAQ